MPKAEPSTVTKALQRCTKEELLELMRPILFLGYVTERQIKLVQAERINRKANQLSDEALAEMHRHTGDSSPEGIKAFMAASAKHDRAMDLWDAADKLREKARAQVS